MPGTTAENNEGMSPLLTRSVKESFDTVGLKVSSPPGEGPSMTFGMAHIDKTAFMATMFFGPEKF